MNAHLTAHIAETVQCSWSADFAKIKHRGLVLLPRDSRTLLNDVWLSLVLDVMFSA